MPHRATVSALCFVLLLIAGLSGCNRENSPASIITPSAPDAQVDQRLLGSWLDSELTMGYVFDKAGNWRSIDVISNTLRLGYDGGQYSTPREGVCIIRFLVGTPYEGSDTLTYVLKDNDSTLTAYSVGESSAHQVMWVRKSIGQTAYPLR